MTNYYSRSTAVKDSETGPKSKGTLGGDELHRDSSRAQSHKGGEGVVQQSPSTPEPPPSSTWPGCGHRVKMILLCDCSICFAEYALFMEHNPKRLCYECWKREQSESRAGKGDDGKAISVGLMSERPQKVVRQAISLEPASPPDSQTTYQHTGEVVRTQLLSDTLLSSKISPRDPPVPLEVVR
jgi:hypothetical protein